jgi:hypothetical protein
MWGVVFVENESIYDDYFARVENRKIYATYIPKIGHT